MDVAHVCATAPTEEAQQENPVLRHTAAKHQLTIFHSHGVDNILLPWLGGHQPTSITRPHPVEAAAVLQGIILPLPSIGTDQHLPDAGRVTAQQQDIILPQSSMDINCHPLAGAEAAVVQPPHSLLLSDISIPQLPHLAVSTDGDRAPAGAQGEHDAAAAEAEPLTRRQGHQGTRTCH